MEEPQMEETESQYAAPGSEEPSLENGYCIHLYVSPEGFRVSSAEPLSHEGTEEEQSGDVYPDLPTALKHIIAEVKSNPVSHDANAEFASGFAEGPGAQGSGDQMASGG